MPEMKISINLDQEVYDAIADALPKFRVETPDPNDVRRSIIGPRWSSPEEWIAYIIETQAAPFLADRPKKAAVLALEEQLRGIQEQLNAAQALKVRVSK
jgi:hypothetical protein